MQQRSTQKSASPVEALFLYLAACRKPGLQTGMRLGFLGFLCSLPILAACQPRNTSIPPAHLQYLQAHTLRLSGAALGTTYNIHIYDANRPALQAADPARLQASIEAELKRLDIIFSSWNPNSELRQLNRAPTGSCQPLSPELRTVLQASDRLYRHSEGAFDPGHARLFGLHGFGPLGSATQRQADQLPDNKSVQHLLTSDGWGRAFALQDCGLRIKQNAARLDVSALAKGYIVDKIYEFLNTSGRPIAMVEIGGEVRVGGARHLPAPCKAETGNTDACQQSYAWRLGIEEPRYGPGRSLYRKVALMDQAMATSGDYRNFKTHPDDPNRIQSHIIDPRSGRPTTSRVRSATVIGPDCMQADALATSLLVLGEKDGLRLLQSYPQYAAFLILGDSPGQFSTRQTANFAPYLLD